MAVAFPTTTVGLLWQEEGPQPQEPGRWRGRWEGAGGEPGGRELAVVRLGKAACVAQTAPRVTSPHLNGAHYAR